MTLAGGVRPSGAGGLFSFSGQIPDRVALNSAPEPALCSSFVLTRAAARAMAQIDAALAERCGKFFWIGAAAGTGKTHFLNYLLGLETRARLDQTHRGRAIAFAVELSGRMRADKLESCVLEALARALGGDEPRTRMNWHGARGVDALNLALGQARHIGVGSISAYLDLGAASADGIEYLRTLAEAAAGSRQVRMMLLAAARDGAPDGAVALEVAPADSREKLQVAIARARTMRDGAHEAAGKLYRAARIEVDDPASVFPFHPDTLNALEMLADPPGTVASLATLIRASLVTASEANRRGSLIYPCDLVAGGAGKIVRERLGEAGSAAIEIARDAVRTLSADERRVGEQIVATLVLCRAARGDRAIPIAELQRALPPLEAGEVLPADLIGKISGASAGVLRLEAGAAVFDPGAAGAPTLAAFNGVLALVKSFAPEIAHPADASHLPAAESRLNEAMAEAAEKAAHTADALTAALGADSLEFPDEHRRALEEYVRLASAGARALEEAGSDPARREAVMRIISDYEALAAAAEMVPQIRAMREYLEGTGLRLSYEDDPARDPQVAALETESQLLAAELAPRIFLHPPRNLDALRARFQKFRWNYVAAYQSAHGAWREEMRRAAALADELRQNAAALGRLNAIAALGAPAGEESAYAAAAQVSKPINPCESPMPLAVELVPRCTECGYVLGTRSPLPGMSGLIEGVRAGIARKLAALSQSAIARIIREHDHAGRLEGFLKITQAAQSDALVRVLDDNLARYLARLLDENAAPEDHNSAATLLGDGAGNGHKRRSPHNGGPARPRHSRH